MDTKFTHCFIKNEDYNNLNNHDNSKEISYFTAKQIATIYGFPQPQPNVVNVIGILSFGGGGYLVHLIRMEF